MSSNPARTRKLIWSPNHARKNAKVNLGLKNLAMLPSYFDYILVHLRQKVRLRPELSPKFLSALGLNPARTLPESELDPKSPARLTTLMCFDASSCIFYYFFSTNQSWSSLRGAETRGEGDISPTIIWLHPPPNSLRLVHICMGDGCTSK